MERFEHDGLIYTIARRFVWALSEGLDFEDLMQAGRLGCIKARKKFDPSRGCSYATYAKNWIHAYIRREVNDRGRTIRVPSHQWAASSRGEAKMPPKALRADAPICVRDGGAPWLSTFASGGPLPDAALEESERRERLQKALARLTPRERAIIRGRYWKDLSLGEIGATIPLEFKNHAQSRSMSRERVRQLEERALSKLRAALGDAPEAP